MVDLLTHVIFSSIYKSRFYPFWKNSSPFLFHGNSTEKENFAKIVISVVDSVNHVIFSSIGESRISPLWESSSPFLLHEEEKFCQNRDERGRLGQSRDFQLDWWESIFSTLGEQFSFFTPRKRKILSRIVMSVVDLVNHVIFSSIGESRFSPLWESSSPFLLHEEAKILPESWWAWSTWSITWFWARSVRVDFLHFGRAVLLFYSTKKKNVARIVMSVVDLVNHVIFSSIGESRISPLWKSSSPFLLHGEEKFCQNRDERGRLGQSRDFHADSTMFSFALRGERYSSRESQKNFSIVFQWVQHMPDRLKKNWSWYLFPISRKVGGGMLSVVVVSDESTRVEHSS